MSIQKLTLFVLLLQYSLLSLGQEKHTTNWSLPTPDATIDKVALIPYPVEVDWEYRDVNIEFPKILISKELGYKISSLQYELEKILEESNGVKYNNTSNSTCTIKLIKAEIVGAKNLEEAYEIKVHKNEIKLIAETDKGIFNALQTLRQLIYKKNGKSFVAGCKIKDWPAFKIRGIMLDCARNFMSVKFIKKHIERLSRYKINTLHLHLTDDPAWRVEIKKHPKLIDSAYHWPTRQPGKHYTQEDLKELVRFSNSRNVLIIPEIDMPGHSSSFKKAMGIDMQTDKGVKYLKDIIDEVSNIFPGPYFHMGSNEVRLKMENFMPIMIKYIRENGKTPIAWSPGLNRDDDVVNMHWGQHVGHKVTKTKPHIDTNGFYMDWIDSQSGVYQFFFQQPCDVDQGSNLALGAITPIWTDGALSSENRVIEQYPFYPCSLTFAERIWRGAREKRIDLMAKLPQPGTKAFEAFAEFENRLVKHRDLYFKDMNFSYVKQSQLKWKLIGPFNHKGKNDTSFEPEKTIKDQYIDGNTTITWHDKIAYGGAIHLRHFYDVFNMHQKKFSINHWPAAMTDVLGKQNGTVYALTFVFSPKAQKASLMFGIGGMWGHSGGYRSARAPSQGEWDFSGGNLWLNDIRIAPPKWPFKSLPWTGWGKGRIEYSPLTEEGYFYRPPVQVNFKKGWNKILVKVPFGWWKNDSGQRKWFFNLIPVTWDGKHYREINNLKYSVNPKF